MVSQSLLVGTFQPCWRRLLSKEAVSVSFMAQQHVLEFSK